MNLYINGESELELASGSVKISVETKYPLDSDIKIKPSAENTPSVCAFPLTLAASILSP